MLLGTVGEIIASEGTTTITRALNLSAVQETQQGGWNVWIKRYARPNAKETFDQFVFSLPKIIHLE